MNEGLQVCSAYYNEWDPFAAQWLRELMSAGLIASGDVDERDIRDVSPDDVRGYDQCHWFAGIGGWSRALQLAGWPDDWAVWTGSCPCPLFSVAGRKKKCPSCQDANVVSHVGRTGYFVCCRCQHEWFADSRHLWPEMWRLISAGRPRYFFGEQVAGSDGETWFTTVRASLEILSYDVRSASLNAAGVGAPHVRQRLFFVGHAEHVGSPEIRELGGTEDEWRLREFERSGHAAGSEQGGDEGDRPSHIDGFWADSEWLWCRDEKCRPAKRRVFPLVDGLPHGVGRGGDPGAPLDANATAEGRKGRLIGYGNAIVPQVAAEFVRAYMESAAFRVPPFGIRRALEFTSSRLLKVHGELGSHEQRGQKMGRTIDICESCGEEKELVSRGLCHNCNMRRDREEKAAFRGQADKHSSAQRKAQERLDAGLVKMMKLLNDFEGSGLVAVEDINAVRLAIKPYVDRIGDSLEPQEDREARERLDAALEDARNDVQAVMGEQYPAKPFTGALSQPETESPSDVFGERANTEHTNASKPAHTNDYKLPPVIEQYRKAAKKENKSTNGKSEKHAAKV